MADIELVIKIPKRVYNYIRKYEHIANSDVLDIKDAIINGTPLPKGHGDLKDASKLAKEIKGYISDTSNLHYDVLEEAEACNTAYNNCLDEIEDAPTIIEADKESEDTE